MSKLLQLRGGTTSEHSSFTGAVREVTVDTTKDTLVVHDGSTAAGFALARESALTTTTALANAALPKSGGTLTGAINMGSNNVTTTGKILYSNMYSALSDLPSASTYHGMFAHVHATGKGYYAHGGAWIELGNQTDLASATTTANAALPKAGGALTGALTTNSTIDGVDIATRDGVLSTTVTTANAALPKAGGALTGALTTNSTIDGVDIATRDGILTSTTATAAAALAKSGGAMTGAITTNSTFDGRDVATDGTKLDNVATPVITGTNTTATNASNHVVSAGGITITLPASPSAGNYVIIKDGTGAAATTTFTVARNGSNIASSASDLTFDKNFAEVVMTYVNSTIGWSV